MRIDNLDISGGVTVRLYALDNGPNEFLTVVLEDGSTIQIFKDGRVRYAATDYSFFTDFNIHDAGANGSVV